MRFSSPWLCGAWWCISQCSHTLRGTGHLRLASMNRSGYWPECPELGFLAIGLNAIDGARSTRTLGGVLTGGSVRLKLGSGRREKRIVDCSLVVQVSFTFAVRFRLLRTVCRFKPLYGFVSAFHSIRLTVPDHTPERTPKPVLEDPFVLPRVVGLFLDIFVAASKGCLFLSFRIRCCWSCGLRLRWLCGHLSLKLEQNNRRKRMNERGGGDDDD